MSKLKRKNVVIAAGMICVLAIASIAALMTDTKSVTNTFTTGDVKIELTEPSWNADNGKLITPNKNIAKDPTIKNVGKNPAYMYMKVEVPKVQDTDRAYKEVFTLNGLDTNKWQLVKSNTTANDKNIYLYAYASSSGMTPVAATTGTTGALFSSVTVNNGLKTLGTNELNIKVDAYGIQTTDLGAATTPDAIWALIAADNSGADFTAGA